MPKVNDLPAFARRLGVDVRDAEILLAMALNQDRTWVLAHPEAPVDPKTAHRVTGWLLRRARGEPLAYLTGQQEFFGLRFVVSPAVLIPRPETERLVEEVLRRIPKTATWTVADLGTGSGCIAVSLAVHRPNLRLVAVDRSARALASARVNARAHAVTRRIRFIRGNLALPLARRRTDAVVANLPYLPRGPRPRHEPTVAVDGGPDGLRHFRTLFAQIRRRRTRPKFVALEIDPRILRGLRKLVPSGYRVNVLTDRSGRDRVLILETST